MISAIIQGKQLFYLLQNYSELKILSVEEGKEIYCRDLHTRVKLYAVDLAERFSNYLDYQQGAAFKLMDIELKYNLYTFLLLVIINQDTNDSHVQLIWDLVMKSIDYNSIQDKDTVQLGIDFLDSLANYGKQISLNKLFVKTAIDKIIGIMRNTHKPNSNLPVALLNCLQVKQLASAYPNPGHVCAPKLLQEPRSGAEAFGTIGRPQLTLRYSSIRQPLLFVFVLVFVVFFVGFFYFFWRGGMNAPV